MATGVVLLMVTFANIFTIIQPVIDSGDWSSTLWMVGGPLFFSLLAWGIYESYRRRMASARWGWRVNEPARRCRRAGYGLQAASRTSAGFSGRGHGFTALPAVDTFQTHLERWERHINAMLAEARQDQLMHLMA